VPNQKKLRFAYLGGPGDALAVFNAWSTGTTLEYFGTNYLKQFYQACADFRAEGYVILTSPEEYSCRSIGNFLLENRPTPAGLRGVRYHIAFFIWVTKIVPRMIRFRPNVFVVTAGLNVCIILSVLKIFGIVIIPAIHDSLWKRYAILKTSERIVRRLQAWFFSCCASEFIVAAESTAGQVRSLIPRKKIQIEVFLPTYPRQQFAFIRKPRFDVRPFRVLFMGRIETNKGVYDLVEVAAKVDPRGFHFDICGVGSQLPSLQRTVDDRGLKAVVSCHGFLDRKELYALLDEAHVVIVPTTTGFEEGFNMVCAEAILAGRPVVTSAVCPALAYIRDAAIEVPPNDVERYREAIIRLAEDRTLYEQKCRACEPLQGQFYDENNSYGAKLRIVLTAVLNRK
jgi:glycosyltransferase involved in cell wall biosynthesis